MAIPQPNVSKHRRWLWGSTFFLLVLATIIWGFVLGAGRLWTAVCGVSIILFMGFYSEYLEWQEQREREGPSIPSRAERRRNLRRMRQRAGSQHRRYR